MQVITITNTKGGVGKSTLALHLAAAIQRQGLSASLVDADLGQRSAAWFLERRYERLNRRAGEPISVVTFTKKPDETLVQRFTDLVKTERDKGRRVIIDTPAGGGRCLNAALDLSTLVITPINESLMDLTAIADDTGKPGALGRRVRSARERRENESRPDLEWSVVVNRVSPLVSRNAGKVGDRLRLLADAWDFDIAGHLTERMLYRELFEDGLTLFDLFRPGLDDVPDSARKARDEMRALLNGLGLPAVL